MKYDHKRHHYRIPNNGHSWRYNNVTTLLKRLFLEQMLITPTLGLVVFFTNNLFYSCRNFDWIISWIISWTLLFLSLTWESFHLKWVRVWKEKKLKKFKECWLFFLEKMRFIRARTSENFFKDQARNFELGHKGLIWDLGFN